MGDPASSEWETRVLTTEEHAVDSEVPVTCEWCDMIDIGHETGAVVVESEFGDLHVPLTAGPNAVFF